MDSKPRQVISRHIIGFALRFAVVFGLLIAPWPGWNDWYASCFRTLGNTAFARNNPACLLYFTAARQTHDFAALDTQIVIGNRSLADPDGRGPVTRQGLDSRSIGWIPTALTLALILASPISWKRRFLASLYGLILVHAFILFSLAVLIWNESTTVSLITLPPFWKTVADGLEYTLIVQMGASFSVPVLIWILVVFGRADTAAFRSKK